MKKRSLMAAATTMGMLLSLITAGTVMADGEVPTPATLILYGEESTRMSDFAEHELHDKVLEAINVDLTVQYLPWSEYAGGKTELMLSTAFCNLYGYGIFIEVCIKRILCRFNRCL